MGAERAASKTEDGHESFRREVREFAESRVAPAAQRTDREGEVSREIVDELSGRGYFGIPIPEMYGGLGRDTQSFAIAIDEISRCCAATGEMLAVHTSVGCLTVMEWGTDVQRERYVPQLARGKMLGAFAITEAGAGSDASSVKATARRDGGSWVIDGTKLFITNLESAGTVVVIARTSPGDHRGLTAFLLEKSAPGIRVGAREKTMGIRASAPRELILEGVRAGPDALLGKEGDGFKVAMTALDVGRIGIAAQAVGIAQAAQDEFVRWARIAAAAGSQMAQEQRVQFAIADIATRVAAARELVRRAAVARDAGGAFSAESSMAKLYASATAVFATTCALSHVGVQGYMSGSALERLARDAKVTEIYEGTSEVQKLVIAKHLMR